MRFHLGSLAWELRGFWPHGERFRADRPLLGPFPATVPGAVQHDLQQAGLLPDLNVGFASRDAEWVEHRDWVYRTTFPTPDDGCARRFLHFEGLDHSGEISLNGNLVGEFRGMFRPVTMEVTGALAPAGQENTLQVIFAPPPEVTGQLGYSSRISILKSRFNYEWDWCPRIVPVGIWDDAWLVGTGPVRLVSPSVVADWVEGEGELRCRLFVEGAGLERSCTVVTVFEGERTLWTGEAVPAQGPTPLALESLRIGQLELSARVPGVRPWWPTGDGEQPLYRVRVTVLAPDGGVSDEQTLIVGFRHIAFVANPDAPPSAIPYTCECNGQRVYLQGVNWVPPTPLYGTLRRADYQPLLERFRRMGCTMLRVWGGAILEKEPFYDLCDEMGLLVWQEFFQSSSGLDNIPCDDPALVDEMALVASHSILRRRSHPCLMAWCGGNEMTFADGTPVTEAHPNIGRLAGVVAAEDPGRMFFPSSPSGPRHGADAKEFGQGLHHDVHGPWGYGGHPDQYTYFNGDDALFRSEMGAPGATRLAVLHRIAGGNPLWPPSRSNPIWVHHGDWWIDWEQMIRLFGPWSPDVPDLPAYVTCSRYLQAEALRFCVESVRRREPHASGALIWMGNEPYANTANNSLLDYDGEPKPAYGVLRRCFAALHLSCRYPRVAWRRGEEFAVTLFLHVRRGTVAPGTTVFSELHDVTGRVLQGNIYTAPVGAGPVTSLGELRWPVKAVPGDAFFLRLCMGTEVGQTYVFTVTDGAPFAPLRQLPTPTLAAVRSGLGEIKVQNRGGVVALLVHMTAEGRDVVPNDFTLLPGEVCSVRVQAVGGPADAPMLLEAMGLPPCVIDGNVGRGLSPMPHFGCS